jgi:hypothetical protein
MADNASSWRLRPARPNHVWPYDFVADPTHDGKAFRMLCIIDEFTRETWPSVSHGSSRRPMSSKHSASRGASLRTYVQTTALSSSPRRSDWIATVGAKPQADNISESIARRTGFRSRRSAIGGEVQSRAVAVARRFSHQRDSAGRLHGCTLGVDHKIAGDRHRPTVDR